MTGDFDILPFLETADKATREQLITSCADAAKEIKALRSALFAIEVHCACAETYDPVIEYICRTALSGD